MTDRVVYTDCDAATMCAGDAHYGLVKDANMVISNGIVDWVGAAIDLPVQYAEQPRHSLGGGLVTPALIDCHTHLVFGGNRAREFEQRSHGVSYAEIAASGGGINSTVMATRAASDDELRSSALARLDRLISEGVAVVEIKSGYGLSIDDELRMLRIARSLEAHRPVKILTTWLAAHAVPPDYFGHADRYIDEVVIPGLHRAHAEGLVDAVDGFCETIAFTTTQIERVFDAARSLGLPVKLHAEQLSDSKGAVLAAKFDALSADHLEYLSPTDCSKLAEADTTAVLLPGAFFALKEQQLPPITALRECGVDLAIATDCNPGSSPLTSLLLAMNMACTLFGLTPEESLAGTTRYAAKALGLSESHGSIAGGMVAELCVWSVSHPAELSYWMGHNNLAARISGGVLR